MKKLIYVLVLVFLMFSFPKENAFAKSEKTFYAKIEDAGVEFCELPDEESGLFEIPSSYFVEIEYLAGDFYKARYLNLDGYVKKDKVLLVDGTPKQAFYDTTLNVVTPYSLTASAEENAQEVVAITKQTQLTYYGTKRGDYLAEENNLWYYVSAYDGENLCFGYVFSQLSSTKPDEKKPTNYEIFPSIDEKSLYDSNPATFTGLSTGTKIMLIVSISVPSLLILYFLIKPTKIMQKSKPKKKSKQPAKRVKHGDYFEFDESEL